MTTYSEFKSFVGRLLWRDGDTVFEGDIDLMVTAAEARLGRLLRTKNRETKATITPTSYRLTLPSDYHHTVELAGPYGTLKYVTAAQMSDYRYYADQGSNQFRGYYTERDTIELGGSVDADNTDEYVLTYRTTLPAYATDGETWVQTKYRDVYLYAVLVETPMYLREDQRYQSWEGMFATRLEEALADDARNQYAERGRLSPSMPSVVA